MEPRKPTVYLVYADSPIDRSLEGIFSDAEKAEAFIDELKELPIWYEGKYSYEFEMQEWEVE
jgi:hypothetical protein